LEFTVVVCRGKQLELTDDLREFPEVVLDARDSDLLTELARRAQSEIGVNWEWLYHHFLTKPDERGRRHQAPFLTAYVEGGRLRFLVEAWLGRCDRRPR